MGLPTEFVKRWSEEILAYAIVATCSIVRALISHPQLILFRLTENAHIIHA